jgi:hypothetical protein
MNAFKLTFDMYYRRKMACLKIFFKLIKIGADQPVWPSQPVHTGSNSGMRAKWIDLVILNSHIGELKGSQEPGALHEPVDEMLLSNKKHAIQY